MGTTHVQTELMQVAQDLLTDVKDSVGDSDPRGSLDYAGRRASRRIARVLGAEVPAEDVLRGFAHRLNTKEADETLAVLDEVALATSA